MRYPSVKTIGMYFDHAKEVRGIMDGKVDLHDEDLLSHEFPVTLNWLRGLYNCPSLVEIKLHAINESLDGHGIECIRGGPSSDDEVIADYINMGDTYASTILYDYHNECWRVTSWGDFVEWAEKKGIIHREGE